MIILWISIFLISILHIKQVNSSLLSASFVDYGPFSKVPEIVLTQLYQNHTLPTYGINIICQNTSLITLSSLDFKCEQKIETVTDVRNIFNAKHQLWICLSKINLVYCDTTWSEVTDCGTFVQVHRPFNETVLAEIQVSYFDGIQPIGMPLQQLCAGNYHIWLVTRTRIGRIITRVAPLYIFYPSC